MTDQQGTLIDGTARARQWRRSRPESAVGDDTGERRSDAPRSIASSLLVPADMLVRDDPSVASLDIRSGSDEPVARASASLLVRETAGAAEDHHTNPFLTPGEPRNRVNDQRRWRNALRRLLTARSIAIGASALCVVAVLAVLTAVLSQSPVQSGTQPQGERGASAKSLEPLKPDLFSASANPFGTNTVVNRPAPRVRPPHRENAERPRNHPAVTPTTSAARTTVHHPVVVARYTPSPATHPSSGVTRDTSSSSGTASTSPAAPPPTPTHYTTSASGHSGSGSSPGSTKPSKSTLRSLVTGAGTCSCQ